MTINQVLSCICDAVCCSGAFRAHLLEGTNYIFSVKQIFCIRGGEEYALYISNQNSL